MKARRRARSCHDISDATRTIAAGTRFRAVIIEDPHKGLGIGRVAIFNHHQLIIGQARGSMNGARILWRDGGSRAAQVNDHNFIAQPIHLGESISCQSAHNGS